MTTSSPFLSVQRRDVQITSSHATPVACMDLTSSSPSSSPATFSSSSSSSSSSSTSFSSSPYLTALLASATAPRFPDQNVEDEAESILEEHVSRVWQFDDDVGTEHLQLSSTSSITRVQPSRIVNGTSMSPSPTVSARRACASQASSVLTGTGNISPRDCSRFAVVDDNRQRSSALLTFNRLDGDLDSEHRKLYSSTERPSKWARLPASFDGSWRYGSRNNRQQLLHQYNNNYYRSKLIDKDCRAPVMSNDFDDEVSPPCCVDAFSRSNSPHTYKKRQAALASSWIQRDVTSPPTPCAYDNKMAGDSKSALNGAVFPKISSRKIGQVSDPAETSRPDSADHVIHVPAVRNGSGMRSASGHARENISRTKPAANDRFVREHQLHPKSDGRNTDTIAPDVSMVRDNCQGQNEFMTSSSSSSSLSSTSDSSSPLMVVGYYFCDEPIPYRSSLVGPRPTLGQFKNLISKKGRYRYFFKKASDEFNSGVVNEEITNDDDILPLWQGKVIGKVELVPHSCSGSCGRGENDCTAEKFQRDLADCGVIKI